MKRNYFSGKKVLITGGTGSWGHELTRQLLEKHPRIQEVRIYSRGEHKQVQMKQEFGGDPRLKFIIGDVRDRNILGYAMRGVHTVFHLAALKHVPVCEENTWEAVLTNVYGTQNVIETAINNNVHTVVDVSTDKAVEPFNLYGVTKACGEKLMINANVYFKEANRSKTKFICIRGGNVIGTNGSVIPLFKKQILEKNTITVTDGYMTRFLMTTRDAIGLIFTAMEHSIGGELFVMRMHGATLSTIAKTMIKLFGNKKTKITTIGLRPGEKRNEVLVSKNEAPFTRVFSKEYYLILPQLHSRSAYKKYKKYRAFGDTEFSSATTRMYDEKGLEKVLRGEQWLWTGK
jgi:UDP-N-acetylglucosamine 4,6-dehydratase/5-epimerase